MVMVLFFVGEARSRIDGGDGFYHHLSGRPVTREKEGGGGAMRRHQS